MNAPATLASGVQSLAKVETEKASRYLQQLCKHFQHKLAVTFDERAGEISFSSGTCRLAANDTLLTLAVTAPDAAHLAQLQDVVARHLLRFAFREEMKIDWHAA